MTLVLIVVGVLILLAFAGAAGLFNARPGRITRRTHVVEREVPVRERVVEREVPVRERVVEREPGLGG